MTDSTDSSKHVNRLAQESSPYLLQHAHNPVDWHPWGSEAFEKARRENKPIFLSVGYSTCYWCHVMERQSFENEAVAAEMNQRFINIKVDREERPDVDQLYMTAVQVLTRHGGWPMSVFLTPDLRPFHGGTYFPPADAHGRPGFVTILKGIENAYRNRPADVDKTAAQLVNILEQFAEPSSPDSPIAIDDALVEELIRRSVSDYDPQAGGFGGAPKFPRQTLLELLLVYLQSPATQTEFQARAKRMLLHTLDALAQGGIRDQLGGGFHRYSTDAQWLVPHFEIMLYDNAMLGWCYVEAYRQTHDQRYAAVARGIFDFILRELTAPAGGFYTALDAEVDSREGLNYLWTKEQVVRTLREALGDGAAQAKRIESFCEVYGLNAGPNFADPHHGSGAPDQNILFLHKPMVDATAAGGNSPIVLLNADFSELRQILYGARRRRKQPMLDTKIITSWNALMIRALAHGGKVLGEARYIAAAEAGAEFLLEAHRAPGGGLFRTSRQGQGRHSAFLDDYAFFIQALLALADATGAQRWKQSAAELAKMMLEKFSDGAHGGFYFTEAGAPDLIVRQKTAGDSPLPSGNAVAAMVLLELGHVAAARQTLAVFAQQVVSQGEGMSAMVQAMLRYTRSGGSFSVSAAADVFSTQPPSVQETARAVVDIHAHWKSPAEIEIRLRVAPGYHINAHALPADLQLVATTVNISGDADAQVDYPPGEVWTPAFADRPLCVYSGEVAIHVRFAGPPGDLKKMALGITYQACDDSACLPPVTRGVEVIELGSEGDD